MQAPPFLTVEQRADYLYARDYFARGSITDAHIARLELLNFHYFLGYARNYRALVGRNHVQVSVKNPDDVFGLIDQDCAISCLLHEGLRTAEWHLRSLAVEHFCGKFEPVQTYLQPDHYRVTSPGSGQRLVENILKHIGRHDEPYVDRHLKVALRGQPPSQRRNSELEYRQQRLEAAKDLPLWAVVDSFSLGLLCQFVMECDTDTRRPVWKLVAEELGIGAQVFETQLKSLTYLRNCVAHHARLWMRPTLDSPKKPRLFASRLRSSHPKSMHWAFINLASFQPSAQRHDFAARVDALLNRNQLHRHGITTVHQSTSPSAG